jgi:hypothetical protein
MTDTRETNHLILSVWLLGVAYGTERQPAKIKTLANDVLHQDARPLWHGVLNGKGAEAVRWFEQHGAVGCGPKMDAVDACLAYVTQTTRDKRAAELVGKLQCGRGAEDALRIAREIVAALG